ncbi:MAG TPA: hypothetical protein VIH89_04195 [Candidatus Sulfotelmatobacter sp.]
MVFSLLFFVALLLVVASLVRLAFVFAFVFPFAFAMPLAHQERIHIVILQRNGFSLLPQNAEGAPHGAPSSESVFFFSHPLKSRISNSTE